MICPSLFLLVTFAIAARRPTAARNRAPEARNELGQGVNGEELRRPEPRQGRVKIARYAERAL